MLKTVTFYNDGKGDDDDSNVGWWWAYVDKDGNREPSWGPFETEQAALNAAADDSESSMREM